MPEKIKVIVLGTRGFPNVQGGVEMHCQNLYPRLARMGCDVTVITRKPYVDASITFYEGVSLVALPCPKNKFLEAIVHTYRGIKLAKKLKPDILHIHAIGPSVFASSAKKSGMKVIMTHHGPDYKRKKWNFFAKLFLKYCETSGVRAADKVIAVSENIARDIEEKFRIKPLAIPNGVKTPVMTQSDDFIKKIGLEKGRYILAVGRFVPEKGFHDLIEAFGLSKTKGWKLVIAGQADHENKYSLDLKNKAAQDPDIILTGFLSGNPLEELYSHAGLFVLPSYYEGLPIALLEAQSYGLSCIAADIEANKYTRLDKERFFKPGDTQAISEKIKAYMGNPLSEQEKKEQMRYIAEQYRWDKIAEKTLHVYKGII